MKKNVFIGVAWPYVNGELHIGHLAGYLLPADICARYNRLIGNDVLMVSGSDCHGTPITVEADKTKRTPREIVEEYHKKDVYLFIETLKLSYNLYTRTDTEFHAKVTQDFFIKLMKDGYIYTDKSKQFYSESEQRFLPDRYVIGTCPHCRFKDSRSDQCDNCGKLIDQEALISPISNISKENVVLRETQHYFLDWPKLQPKIEKYVNDVSTNWKEWVRSESLAWLKEGLKPRPITRDIDWGVKIPKEKIPQDMLIEGLENKRLYVWFDAVIGYFSASLLWAQQNNTDWKKFWYGENLKHYYFMGKDNLVFHTLFWPGKLIVYDKNLHLPDVLSINMFLNFKGEQFSKSRGVVIQIKDLVEKYGNDRIRFYLTLVMPETRDSSFDWQDFKKKVNGILVDNIGNFIHRTLSMAKRLDSIELSNFGFSDEIKTKTSEAFSNAKSHLEDCEFRNYLDEIISLSSFGNKYLDEKAPWNIKDSIKYRSVVLNALGIVISLAHVIQPLLPETSQKLFTFLGMESPDFWPQSVLETQNNTKLNKNITPLFEKIELA